MACDEWLFLGGRVSKRKHQFATEFMGLFDGHGGWIGSAKAI